MHDLKMTDRVAMNNGEHSIEAGIIAFVIFLLYSHCSHSMRQSLCNGTVSVCQSIYRLLQQRAVGLLLWALLAGDIDRLLHDASAAGAAAFRS